jgi:hypothetical protein
MKFIKIQVILNSKEAKQDTPLVILFILSWQKLTKRYRLIEFKSVAQDLIAGDIVYRYFFNVKLACPFDHVDREEGDATISALPAMHSHLPCKEKI